MMNSFSPVKGLVAATHTPFHADGSLNLARVEDQARHFQEKGVKAVFVAGTTGESFSLAVDERLQLARRWAEVVRGTSLKLVVHVGHNCLTEARQLAAEAEKIKADAIAAISPNFFKPATVSSLVAFCRSIAEQAASLPFYYYDIPVMTGVDLSMREFLEQAADDIPTLAGLKYTNPNLAILQECLAYREGALDILFGIDEILCASLGLGIKGAIGSTYNFAPSISLRIMEAFQAGDLEKARSEQRKTVKTVNICSRYGYMGAGKAVMKFLGIDCGPVRPPLDPLPKEKEEALRSELEKAGFFDWIR